MGRFSLGNRHSVLSKVRLDGPVHVAKGEQDVQSKALHFPGGGVAGSSKIDPAWRRVDIPTPGPGTDRVTRGAGAGT